jgi:hypothetical protein
MTDEVETVAYRWRWPETMEWHYRCYNAHPDAETVEGLVRRSDYDSLITRLRAAEAATEEAVGAFKLIKKGGGWQAEAASNFLAGRLPSTPVAENA